MKDLVPSVQSQDVRSSGSSDFESVYREHFGYVWNTLRRLGIPERHLEDVAHDVFVAVYRRFSDYESGRPMKPWLFGFCFRVASDHRKKAANKNEVLEELDVADEAPNAESLVDDAARRRLVLRALDGLDIDRRAVFVMHELDGESAPSIAKVLEIPVNTVYSRLRVAREEFAKAVKRLELRGGARD